MVILIRIGHAVANIKVDVKPWFHLCYNQADCKALREFVKLRLSHTDLSEMEGEFR